MIFGFGRRDDDDDDEDEEEFESVIFQGAVNGKNPDLTENSRLVQAGLVPAKDMVSEALSRRAEMIRLEPKGKAAVVTYFIDGVAYPASKMPAQRGLAMTQMLKLLAGLDIKQRSKPQKGGIKAEFDEKDFELRIDTQPLQGGAERLIVRAQDTSVSLEKPRDLGFSESLIEKIREVGSSKQGLLLAAGPPFSGVTTMAIALLRSVDPYLYSIYCVADLGGRELSHVRMFETKEGDNLETTLARARREDADVIMVDALSDKEQARVVLEECKNLSIVSEIPAKDAAEGIARLVQLVGDPKLVAEQVKVVISQKLIRVLCKKCRHAYRPNPKLLAKVGLPPETSVLYRPPKPGDDEDEEEVDFCETCGGTGYFGRTGLVEAIEVNDEIKQIILKGGEPNGIRSAARAAKMQTFQSDGIRLVAEGRTSLEELQRAFRSK